MAIDPVKIPQNVYVEDHIIGPITLRQLFLSLAGAGVSYVLFAIIKKAGQLNLISGILAWSPLAIMAAFAFIRINDISFLKFLILLVEKKEKPAVRYWQVRKGISINPKTFVPRKSKDKNTLAHSQDEYDQINKLSSVLDSGPIFEKKDEVRKDSSESPTTKETQPDTENTTPQKAVSPQNNGD